MSTHAHRAARAPCDALAPRSCVLAACLGLAALSACTPKTDSAGGGTAGEIVIGASLPLSGALAGFGSFQKWGYEHAVAEVNAAGGIAIQGVKKPVRLVLRDDKTDANVVASNIDTLATADKADALLGSCTPPLVIAGALAAERHATPFVSGCAPMVSFRQARQWSWAWDVFFSDPELAEAPFKALADLGVTTNRKIAILHDNSADGSVVGGTQWPALAKQYGYTVAVNVEFPTDTSDFSASVQQAMKSGADIVLTDTVTPQAVSIRKQLAAAGYTPKVLVMEKGAEPTQFGTAVGPLASGVMVGGYWDPSFPYAGAKALGDAYAKEAGSSVSQHIADSYTAARVLLDAIASAGTLDKATVNRQIAATDKEYPVGRVKFAADHTATLPIVSMQWSGQKQIVVWPKDRATGEFVFPVPAAK